MTTLRRTRESWKPNVYLLSVPALAAPVLLLVESLVDRHVGTLPITLTATVLFVLVVVRLSEVARVQRNVLRNLEATRTDKDRLLARTLEVAEHDRTRVAVSLHDGPIQRLTAVTLRLDLLVSRLAKGDVAGAQEHAELARAGLAREMAAIRALMTELRPPVLDEGGLPAALQDCALQILDGSTIEARVQSEIGPARLAPELETALYRITREALQNVRKHSQASDVEVSLTAQNGHVRLVVSDNGAGFDAHPVGDAHLGLLAMREMAEGLGGRCDLTSTLRKGTRIDVVVPRKEAPAPARHAERSMA